MLDVLDAAVDVVDQLLMLCFRACLILAHEPLHVHTEVRGPTGVRSSCQCEPCRTSPTVVAGEAVGTLSVTSRRLPAERSAEHGSASVSVFGGMAIDDLRRSRVHTRARTGELRK